jgi:uncharacterized protein (DUF58 family)
LNNKVTRQEAWSRVALLLLVIGLVFQRAGLLALVGVMIAVFGVAWYWNRASLISLFYRRKIHYRRAFPGEKVPCEIEVENSKWLPLGWLVTEDRWPLAVGPEEEQLLAISQSPEDGLLQFVLAMRWFHRIRRGFSLVFRRRGIYTVGPAHAYSGDPFGVFESQVDLEPQQSLIVFPEIKEVEELELNPRDPFGPRKTTRRLFEDISNPMGIRDYRPEDSFRKIHWPATARVGRLQTRVYQPVSGLDLIICLNVATFDPYWLGVRTSLLEALLSTAASHVYRTFRLGYRVGLTSNGGIAHMGRSYLIPPGRSPQQLPRLLEALAGVTPVVISEFGNFLIAQAPRMEYGSTLLIITAVMTSPITEALIRLKSRARKVMLISLAQEEVESISGVDVIHQPFIEGKEITS